MRDEDSPHASRQASSIPHRADFHSFMRLVLHYFRPSRFLSSDWGQLLSMLGSWLSPPGGTGPADPGRGEGRPTTLLPRKGRFSGSGIREAGRDRRQVDMPRSQQRRRRAIRSRGEGPALPIRLSPSGRPTRTLRRKRARRRNSRRSPTAPWRSRPRVFAYERIVQWVVNQPASLMGKRARKDLTLNDFMLSRPTSTAALSWSSSSTRG